MMKRFLSIGLWIVGCSISDGCISSYRVALIDDGKSGWVSFEEFNSDIENKHVAIVLKNGLSHKAEHPTVSSRYTQWKDKLTGDSLRVQNDSIRTIEYSGWARGIFDGLVIGLTSGFAVGAMVARYGKAPEIGFQAWATISVVCGVVGGLKGHTFRYHFTSNPEGLKSDDAD